MIKPYAWGDKFGMTAKELSENFNLPAVTRNYPKERREVIKIDGELHYFQDIDEHRRPDNWMTAYTYWIYIDNLSDYVRLAYTKYNSLGSEYVLVEAEPILKIIVEWVKEYHDAEDARIAKEKREADEKNPAYQMVMLRKEVKELKDELIEKGLITGETNETKI